MFLFRSFSILKKSFEQLLVSPEIISKLSLKGIKSPSALQESLIPAIHSHSDIFLKDETGSGKTLGIVLGVLSKKAVSPLNPVLKLSKEDNEFAQRRLNNAKFVQTLIVVPTRDLASQIYHWILELEQVEDIDHLVQLAISSKEKNNMTRPSVPKILIGTPPKILEMIERKELDLSRLQTLVMDEADRLIMPLSRYADIKRKFNRHSHRPPGEQLISDIIRMRRIRERFTKNPVAIEDQAKQRRLQVIISSATANNPLKMLLKTKKWICNPVHLNIGGKIPSKIKHIAYYLDSNEILKQVATSELDAVSQEEGSIDNFKPISIDVIAESIASICNRQTIKKAMIFVHSEYSVADLVSNLDALGLKSARLSDMNNFDGDKKQTPFASWLRGSVDIVVGTEYEARGLDIPNLEHVIIVGTVTPASYTHMSGRTGRFGKSGTAITLLTDYKQKSRFNRTLQLLDIKLS